MPITVRFTRDASCGHKNVLSSGIINYKRMNFIPSELKNIVQLEGVDQYTELCNYSRNIKSMNIDVASSITKMANI
jgi:hypothetical protein